MHEWAPVAGFLIAASLLSLVWARSLWYLSERSPLVRRLVFFLMGYTHRQFSQISAVLLSSMYYLVGLFAGLGLAIALQLPVPSLFPFGISYVALSLIGIVGEISLANLLIDLATKITGMAGPERFAEMNEVPWIRGLQQLPPALVPVAAATGGVVEELFFRGVILRCLTDRLGVAPPIAIAIAGMLFIGQQLLQVRTAFQALVIGGGCIAIALVGGCLVVITGSVVPALIAHASFVLFFMSPEIARPSYRHARQQGY